MSLLLHLSRRALGDGWLVTLTVLALMVPALTAHRARADGQAANESTEYRTAIDSALEEYRVGHFEEARGLFEHAHALDPSARTLRGLGMVEFELRHYVRASALLESALMDARKPLPPSQRTMVEELLTRTRHFVARYQLEVVPEVANLGVELDGVPVELGAERRITVSAGEHKLSVIAPGHLLRELRLDAKGGEERTLRVVLRAQEQASPSPLPVAEPARPPASGGRRAAAIALSIVGASALSAGAVIGAMALKKADDAPDSSGPEADSARSLARGFDAAIAVGVVCVVTGVILLIKHKRQARGSEQRRDLLGGAGARLRVAF